MQYMHWNVVYYAFRLYDLRILCNHSSELCTLRCVKGVYQRIECARLGFVGHGAGASTYLELTVLDIHAAVVVSFELAAADELPLQSAKATQTRQISPTLLV